MSVGHTQFVVGMQVMRSTTDVHNAVKIIFAKPDDFFLPAHFAMAGAVPAGSLADGELILDNPDQITRLDTKRPLAAEFL
jgi:hypothetical protein